jgi:hypothetical protein
LRDNLAAAEGADPERGNSVTAEAAGSGTWSRGTGLVLIRSLPYTLACTAKSASGMAGGFIGRQPVTISALKTSIFTSITNNSII